MNVQGTGRQMRGAQIYAFTHWCVGPFLLWLLPFHFGLGVQGIWATLAVISNLQVFFMSVRLLFRLTIALPNALETSSAVAKFWMVLCRLQCGV